MNRTPEHIYNELLVMRCQDRERSALDELVSYWQPRLWRHALRLTKEPGAASDVMQEAWMAVVRGIGRLDDPARFRQWAYRIVTHKAADWVRRRQRDRRLVEQAGRDASLLPDGTSETEDDDITELRRAIQELPERRRMMLTLYYFEGMAISEIAGIFDIPRGTVKSRLYHTRQQLKLKLKLERRS